ncbi:phosphotransferase [Paenibacillus endoradicis]|uniref:phosphotransferase n=1 Tax=Paenibacillus endoradicis TaxID=2972487 RepID=UPI0021593E7C|nr:phosphotransferase [Paenibacillus endoradicis]MCR8657363.1 phosphotransferase [Paenibacillus endoradicis]
MFKNNTKILIENKLQQLNSCLQQIFNSERIAIKAATCDDIGYTTLNFTTAGIYHLHGVVIVEGEQMPWSIILKIIKADSLEKEESTHHNYWQREALVYESKLLDDLPNSIRAPKCYLIEEQQDNTIWMWMERVIGRYAEKSEHFDYIARQLGRFNGDYLTTKEIPNQEWICRNWLRSWITASRMYAPSLEDYSNSLLNDEERNIWDWYQTFSNEIERNLFYLEKLPRVLAHQDMSQMNMFIVENRQLEDELVLIDWQFMSISGVGEDLAKMFGVNMSQGIIPTEKYNIFQENLYEAYINGLHDMGWQGNEQQARYGYCIGTALRSVWEVPKYFTLAAQLQSDKLNQQLQDSVAQLREIIIIQMAMAYEAENLKENLFERITH